MSSSSPFDGAGGFDDIAPPRAPSQGAAPQPGQTEPSGSFFQSQTQYSQYQLGSAPQQNHNASRGPTRAVQPHESNIRRHPPEWVPDAATLVCMAPACRVEFDTFERRHHCRYNGQIYCEKCSSRSMLMPPFWDSSNLDYKLRDPQRVCDASAVALEPFQKRWSEENANAVRENSISLDDYSTRYLNSPLRFTLGGEIRKAAYSLTNLQNGVNFWEGDEKYFREQLAGARALLFITVGKVAFIGGVKVGTGLVVARLNDASWSAPCAVGSFGLTFGAVVGAEVTDFVTPLDAKAVDEFCDTNTSKVAMGGEVSLALGPLGRTAGGEALVSSDANTSSTTSYAQSRGLYGGVTLDASYVQVRDDVNLKFYGRPVNAADLLRGIERQPNAAAPLYEQLHAFYASLDRRVSSSSMMPPAPAGNHSASYFGGEASSYDAVPAPAPPPAPYNASWHGTTNSGGGGGHHRPGAVGDSLWGNKPTKNPFAATTTTTYPAAVVPPAPPPTAGRGPDVVEV